MKYPSVFGKYLLLARVNVGGMAEVFKAKTFGVEGFERILAIKRILPNVSNDEEYIKMFIDEARIAVGLAHSNIVEIYELGSYRDQYYMAMEYVSGRDLRQILDRLRKQEAKLPVAAAALIACKICDGLDYAHRKTDPSGQPLNVIHRDVSPQNVLVSFEGAIKLTDFGIAKAENRASHTQAGVLKGKFGYMSPEQVRGLELDQRSDLFAVGILLYEMLTANRLFVGSSDFSTLEKVRNAEFQQACEVAPQIPEELNAIINKALAKDRNERYANAGELHDALQQFLIIDNTIYNERSLAKWMAENYSQEIEDEARRQEKFNQIKEPLEMSGQAQEHSSAKAPSQDEWGMSASKAGGEHTMIFEAGSAFADAPTQLHQAVSSQANVGKARRQNTEQAPPLLRSKEETFQNASRVVAVNVKHIGHPQHQQASPSGWLIGGSALFFVLTISVALWYYITQGDTIGTIILVTTPSEQIDVFLDGVKITQKTPYTHSGIAPGEHKILLKSPGYEDYQAVFTLKPGAPAAVRVDLVKSKTDDIKQIDEMTLLVETEPSRVSVRIGNLPQGVTPLVLKIDPQQNTSLGFEKEGYKPIAKTVSFSANDLLRKRKSVRYKLERDSSYDSSTTTVLINSIPRGARVNFDGRTYKTPVRVSSLDRTRTYDLSISKGGYEPYTTVVNFNNRQFVKINTRLKRKNGRLSVKTSGAENQACGGMTSRLSVMPRNAQNCEVSVGSKKMGTAPFFEKRSPSGTCDIQVRCDEGKSHSSKLTLKPGRNSVLIVKDEMWN
jgi:serine/threonine protein kinase